eukprot:TRINITY_DN10861_c0_g1_i1.p1 TRINITY_DN10861_c0_g1~~TRINITY_DN10861_c0_g1_i1.p1  ORF type:complete len:314 (+),score=142.61 TRINITY_DN10861_c0_g1_i1:112-942(+)
MDDFDFGDDDGGAGEIPGFHELDGGWDDVKDTEAFLDEERKPSIEPEENFEEVNIGEIISLTATARGARKRKMEALSSEEEGDDAEAKKARRAKQRSYAPNKVDENDAAAAAAMSLWRVKRDRKVPFTDEETRRFYNGLSMFGTSTVSITNLLPGRVLKEVEQKYNAELRQNKKKVQYALSHRKPIDIAMYTKYRNLSERVREEIEKAKLEETKGGRDLQPGEEGYDLAHANEDAFTSSVVERAPVEAPVADPMLAGVVSETIGGEGDAEWPEIWE